MTYTIPFDPMERHILRPTDAEIAALALLKVGDEAWLCCRVRYPLRPEFEGSATPVEVIAVTACTATVRREGHLPFYGPIVTTYYIGDGTRMGGSYGRDYSVLRAAVPANFRLPEPRAPAWSLETTTTPAMKEAAE